MAVDSIADVRTLIREGVPAFFDWWLAELVGLLPVNLRSFVLPEKKCLIVDFTNEDAVFSLSASQTHRELARLQLNDRENAGRVKSLLGKDALSLACVVARLPAHDTLRKSVTLPIAAEENLREVLAFEMDRHTPFVADRVYYDFAVLSRDHKAGLLRVMLTVVPRDRLDEMTERLEAWGLSPSVVDVAGAGSGEWRSDGREGINLLPPDRRGRRARGMKVWNGILTGLVVVLAAGALTIPIVQRQQVIAALQPQVEAMQARAKEVRLLETELEKSSAQVNFVLQKKREAPPVVEIVEELTQLIPDDTWLDRFELSGTRIKLKGESPEASALISLIESSELFSNTRFEAPITLNQRSGNERFVLTSRVAARESP